MRDGCSVCEGQLIVDDPFHWGTAKKAERAAGGLVIGCLHPRKHLVPLAVSRSEESSVR
jgi:hypothetical protein